MKVSNVKIDPVISSILNIKGLGLIHKPWNIRLVEFYGLHKVIIYWKVNDDNIKIERRGRFKVIQQEVISNEEDNFGGRYTFRVICHKINSNGSISSFKRELFLSASSEVERDKWIYILNVYTSSSRSSYHVNTLEDKSSFIVKVPISNLYTFVNSGFNLLLENIFKENRNNIDILKLGVIFSNCLTLFTNSIQIKKIMCKSMGQQLYNLANIILDKNIYSNLTNISDSYIRRLKISLIEVENHFRRLAELGFLTVIIEESDENYDFYLYCSAIEILANDLFIALNYRPDNPIMCIDANTVDDKLINQAKRIMYSEDSLDLIVSDETLLKEFADMIDCDVNTMIVEIDFVREKQREIYYKIQTDGNYVDIYSIIRPYSLRVFWKQNIKEESCSLDEFISLIKSNIERDDEEDLTDIFEKLILYLQNYITKSDINNTVISIVHLMQASRFLDTRADLLTCIKLMSSQRNISLLPCLLTDQFEFEYGKEQYPIISLNYGLDNLKKAVKALTSCSLTSMDEPNGEIKIINFYGKSRIGKTITILRACHILLNMRSVIFIDMMGLHDMNAANVLYNDETKEIQLLFRVMVQLGIYADNATDLAQTFNDFFTSLTSSIIVLDHYNKNSEACKIIKNALQKINNSNGEIIIALIHMDYDDSVGLKSDNIEDSPNVTFSSFTDDDAINMMLDLYYCKYNADLGFLEEDVKLLVKMCSNRPGLINSLSSVSYTIVSQFVTDSSSIDDDSGTDEITVNISNFQNLLYGSLKKEDKVLAECLSIFTSTSTFFGQTCYGYKFHMKLAWSLCENIFKKEGHLIWKRAFDSLVGLGIIIFGERGQFHIATSYGDSSKSCELTTSTNIINSPNIDLNLTDIVQDVLFDLIDSIISNNVASPLSSPSDEFGFKDFSVSDFNGNIFGNMMTKHTMSTILLESYKVYTLFWCKELVNLSTKLTNSNDSIIHILMSFDENRVHFELILAIIVEFANGQSNTDSCFFDHIILMVTILSSNANSVLSRRLLPKHHTVVIQSIIYIFRVYIESKNNCFEGGNDTNIVDVELKYIDCSLGLGELLHSFDSLKEGIKHMQKTISAIYDFYSKYPDLFKEKSHLSTAFFCIFKLLDRKIKKSQRNKEMILYYLGLKESYIIEYIEIFTSILGEQSDIIRECRFQLATSVFMMNKRYTESISILNELYITSNESVPIYCDVIFNLASCHYEVKEYDRAKILYMKALEKKRATGDDSELNLSSIASILNSLGHIHYDQVQIDAAKIAYEEAYSICKRLLGSDHIFVINIMTSIANCNMTNCDYDNAHKIFYRISNKLKDKKLNDQIDAELVHSIIKLHKVYLYQYSNDKNRYKLLIEQVLDMLNNLLDQNDPIIIQAKKDYKAVINEGGFIRRLSLPSKSTNTNIDENQNEKNKRKSMFESIPFLTT